MIEYPPLIYFLFALAGPSLAIRGAAQLFNATFLRDWTANYAITVTDVWKGAFLRLTTSLIFFFIIKEKPEWLGDQVKFFIVLPVIFGASAIYELITLKSRVGKHPRSFSPRTATIINVTLILGGIFFTYLFWIHPILFGHNLVGIEQ